VKIGIPNCRLGVVRLVPAFQELSWAVSVGKRRHLAERRSARLARTAYQAARIEGLRCETRERASASLRGIEIGAALQSSFGMGPRVSSPGPSVGP